METIVVTFILMVVLVILVLMITYKMAKVLDDYQNEGLEQ